MPGIIVGGGGSNQETTLDKILKGLALANQGVGLASGIQNFRTSMAEKDKSDRQERQEFTYPEYNKMGQRVVGTLADGPIDPNSLQLGPNQTVGKLLGQDGKVANVILENIELAREAKRDKQHQESMDAAAKRDARAGRAEERRLRLDEEAKNKPSDAQSLSAGFSARIQQAEDVFSKLEKEGFDRASVSAAAEQAATNLPFGLGEAAAIVAQSSQSKEQQQAERNFLTAVLRKESGASISKEERAEGALQYFPRVGDTPEVKEQKRLNRLQAYESMIQASGPAAKQIKRVEATPKAGKEKGLAPETKSVGGKTYKKVPGGWQEIP